MITPQLPQADYDARWKAIVQAMHKEFMEFFFPKHYSEIDFSKGVRFLDKELQEIFADWKKKGKRESDILMEYHLHNKKKLLVIVHAEIQRSFDPIFKERMFISGYRLKDRFKKHQLAALAIYTGASLPANPQTYTTNFWGTEWTYKFNTYIVRDYKNKETELKASKNPFAYVILTCVYLLKAGKDLDLRAQFKLKLARLCFSAGFTKEQIQNLLIFVTFAIAIRQEDEITYLKNIQDMNDSKARTLYEINHDLADAMSELIHNTKVSDVIHFLEKGKKGATPEKQAAIDTSIAFVSEALFEVDAKGKIKAYFADKLDLLPPAHIEMSPYLMALLLPNDITVFKARLEAFHTAKLSREKMLYLFHEKQQPIEFIADLFDLEIEEVKAIIEADRA